MIDLPTCRIATAGEALIDLVAGADQRFQPCLGGAVYNLTRALALQGVPTLYLNPLSSDRFGRQLAQGLFRAGVQLARPDPVAQVTSLAVVAVDAQGQPDYAFYREGVADRAVSAEQLIQSCDQARPELVCTGALALDPRDAAVCLPWLAAQRRAARAVVVDVNMRLSVMQDSAAYRRHVGEVLLLADIVKASDEDLACLGLEAPDPLAQGRLLLERSHAHWMALTCGADGAYLLTRHGECYHWKEPRKLTIADTVGAGDCFLAGLLARWFALALPMDWGRSGTDAGVALDLLQHAVASASINVQRQGCQPPSREEMQDWLRAPANFTT